jgi:flagellar basal-body rod protein FlgF
MDAVSVAAIGMQNDLRRMSSTSQNLANVSTPGYKREISIDREFEGEFVRALTGVDTPKSTTRDMSVGALRGTSNPLDIAIENDAFFEVQTERGIAFTRQGNMHVDARGRIVTASGDPLMGIGGELTVSNSAISVNEKGEIRQAERIVGQIRLTRFSNPEGLAALGNGLYARGTAVVADGGISGKLRSGFQEASNVNSAREMVHLTETVRHFETMQKIMQGYDDLFEKTMRKLGDF